MSNPPIIQGSPLRPSGTPLASLVPVFVTVFLITVIISTAITFILPESFASTCRIKVEPDVNPGTSGMAYDPYFIQTTFEIIQSQLVLDPVIAKLNLNVEWGKKYFNGETLKTSESVEILKGRTSLAPVRGTKLIAITVYSDDRNEAARIANAIAESYRDYRMIAAGKLDETIQTNSPVQSQKLGKAGHRQDEPDKTAMVEITDRAEPGREPVKPNKPLNIALGVVAGIVLGSVAAALVGFFKSRSQTR